MSSVAHVLDITTLNKIFVTECSGPAESHMKMKFQLKLSGAPTTPCSVVWAPQISSFSVGLDYIPWVWRAYILRSINLQVMNCVKCAHVGAGAGMRYSRNSFCIQGSSYLLGERFSACFVLKFALQREGEKGDNVNLKTKHTKPLTQETIPKVWENSHNR